MATEATSGSDYSLAFIARMDLSELENDLANVEAMIANLVDSTSKKEFAPKFDLTGLYEFRDGLSGIGNKTVDVTTVADGTALENLNSSLASTGDKSVNVGVTTSGDNEAMQKILALEQVVDRLTAQIKELHSSTISPKVDTKPFIDFEVASSQAKESFTELKTSLETPAEFKVDTSQLLEGEALVERLKIILAQEESQQHTIQLNGGNIDAVTARVATLRGALVNLGQPVEIGLPQLPAGGLQLGENQLNPAETEAATEAYNKLNQTVAQLTSTFTNMAEASRNGGTAMTEAATEEIGIIQALINTRKELQAASTGATGIEELKEYNASLQLTEEELTRMKNIGKEGFDELGNAVANLKNSLRDMGLAGVTSIEEIIQANDGAAASVQQLIALQQELTAQRNATTDPQQRADLNYQISDVKQATSSAQNAGTDGYDLVGNKVDQVTEAIQRMRDAGVLSVADIIEANDGEMYSMEQLIELQQQLTTARAASTDINDIASYNSRLQEAAVAMGQLKNIGTAGFDEFGNKINTIAASLSELGLAGVTSVKEIIEANGGEMASIEQLIALQKELTAARLGASSTEEASAYNKELQNVEQSIGRVSNVGRDGFDSMGNKIVESTSALEAFGSKAVTIGISMAVFFAVQKVIEFATAIVDIIPKLDGVNQGFLSLGGSSAVLDQLRTKTQGLLSDLDLERQFNKFADFGIPAAQLGTILQEVSKQAETLGLTIDQQVDKAIQALGTNGNRALAGLGISTSEFKGLLDEGKTRAEALMIALQKGADDSKVHIETLGETITKLKVSMDNALSATGSYFEQMFAGAQNTTTAGVNSASEALNAQYGLVNKLSQKQITDQTAQLQKSLKDAEDYAAAMQKIAADHQPVGQALFGTGVLGQVAGAVEQHEFNNITAIPANNELKALQDRIAALNAINPLLQTQKDHLSGISALEKEQADLLKSAEDLPLKTPDYQAKEDDLRAQAAAIGKHIDAINGKDAQDAIDAAVADRKKRQKEILDDYNRSLQKNLDLQQQLNDEDQASVSVPLDKYDKAIADAEASYKTRMSALSDQELTAEKAGVTISGFADQAQHISDNRDSAVNKANYDRQSDKAIADQKISNKAQDDGFSEEMDLRKKLYSDELSFETKYGIDAAQQQYGYSTTATEDYLSYLNSKADQLAINIDLYPMVNAEANRTELDKTEKKIKEVTQATADATAAYGAGLMNANQSYADKVQGIQDKLKSDLSKLYSPSTKASQQSKDYTAKRMKNKAAKATQNVKSPEMQDAQDAAAQVAPVLVSLGASFTTLGDAIGKTNKGLGDMISYVGGALSEIGGLTQAFAQGGPIGLLLKGISDLAGAVASVFTSQAKAAADLLAYQNKANQLAVEYAITMREAAVTQALADQTHLKALQAGLDLINKDTSTNQSAQEDIFNQIRGGTIVTGQHTEHNFFGKAYNRNDTQSAAGLSDQDILAAGKLGELQGTQLVLYNKLVALQAEGVNLIAEQAAQTLALNNALVGQTADSLNSAFMNSINSISGATGSITAAIRKSVLAGLDAAYIKPIADAMFKEMAKDASDNLASTGSSVLTPAQIAKIRTDFTKPYADAITNVNTVANALVGPDPSQASNMSTAISGITSSQADLLAGQFGGLRLTAVAQLSIQTAMLSELQKLAGDPQNATNLLLATTAGDTSVATPDTAASTALMQSQLAALIAIKTSTDNTDKNTAPINASLQLIYKDMVKSGQASQQLNQQVRATGRPATR